jgi:hypothetical protein
MSHVDIAKLYDTGEIAGVDLEAMAKIRQGVEANGAIAYQAGVIAQAVAGAKPVNTYLWDYYHDAYGHTWQPFGQNRGICVGCAVTHAAELAQAFAHVVYGEGLLKNLAIAPIYAGGRVEVSNWVSRSDGSTGSASAKWLAEAGGLLSREECGIRSFDDDEDSAVSWAANRSGVPAGLETTAKSRQIKDWCYWDSVQEIGLSIVTGLPVTHGSNIWADGLDQSGHARVTAHRGGHQQTWSAVEFDRGGNVERLFCQNSWRASYGQGGYVTKGSRTPQPAGGTWYGVKAIESTIRNGDAIAIAWTDALLKQRATGLA